MDDEETLDRRYTKPTNGKNRAYRHKKQLQDGVITQEEYDRLYVSRAKAQRQLRRIFKRDKGKCYICKKRVKRESASREHIIALVDGGTNDDSNVKLAHIDCNASKEAERVYALRLKQKE